MFSYFSLRIADKWMCNSWRSASFLASKLCTCACASRNSFTRSALSWLRSTVLSQYENDDHVRVSVHAMNHLHNLLLLLVQRLPKEIHFTLERIDVARFTLSQGRTSEKKSGRKTLSLAAFGVGSYALLGFYVRNPTFSLPRFFFQ